MNQSRVFKISFKKLLDEILDSYNVQLPEWNYENNGDNAWKAYIEIVNPLSHELKLYFHSYGYKVKEEAEEQGAQNVVHYLQTLLEFKVEDVNYKLMHHFEMYYDDAVKAKYELLQENEELKRLYKELLKENKVLKRHLYEIENSDAESVAMN